MQLGFYFDQTRCTGCYTCAVACKDWHDISAGPVAWMRLLTIERGEYPVPWLAFLTVSCYHCAKPACIDACPVGSITKRDEDGIVIVDQETCLGKDCGLCKVACPYDVPQFGAAADAMMQKCDLCWERWEQGKKPICVEACHMYALDAGPLNELREKYGDRTEAEGFRYSADGEPSIIFKPKE